MRANESWNCLNDAENLQRVVLGGCCQDGVSRARAYSQPRHWQSVLRPASMQALATCVRQLHVLCPGSKLKLSMQPW